MLDYMEVDATKLRQLREARAYSLRELEELSGVSYNTIWFIEAGRRKRTHPRTVRKLAQALGVEPTELMKGRG
jgi:transcriptional regulator with XRE-family HTH domain